MKMIKKHRLLAIGIVILILVIIGGITLLITKNNQQVKITSGSPLSSGNAEFEKKYGMTRVEFNQHWDNNDGYKIVYNKDHSQLSDSLQSKLMTIDKFNVYKQSLGKGNKDFYDYLISNGINLKPIDNDLFSTLYARPDTSFKVRSYIEQPNHEILFVDDQTNSVFSIGLDIFQSPNKNDIARLLDNPQIEFKDRLTPDGETKFYPELGIALYTNTSDYRFQLYIFKSQTNLDENFIKTVGLNGRSQAGNPNSIFVE